MGITVNDICTKTDAELLCGNEEKEFCGVYVGDLLSRAMSHIDTDNVWITIMANVNVVAVATLTEPAAILLAEGVVLPEDVLERAEKNGITVLSSPHTAYELCLRLNELALEKKV